MMGLEEIKEANRDPERWYQRDISDGQKRCKYSDDEYYESMASTCLYFGKESKEKA